jgi:winged helix DNA-binding protein
VAAAANASRGTGFARAHQIRDWLRDNNAFRRYVLAELCRRGPLPQRELEDRSVRPWESRGWTHDKNVSQMLGGALFGFRYRLEIYVPKPKHEYGYFVLPILHGDRLVGRIDPLFDRRTGLLRVHEVYAEPGAPKSAGPAVAQAIARLAGWLGAGEVAYSRVPAIWASAFRHTSDTKA